ncbi:MAG: hypothetical protein J0I99_16070 [Devosia sp.]|uniref:hypothetical protein n=1 Tax=Devosia sp. TaxID=1871048 RepID=UPI001ACF785A|nr:hypothetical protein [Devosia sp.]MBN9308355.1 hypothetical protein [Devosia sp.]MBN9317260.1 hypothetical protein [Devosia sp.]
MTRTSIRHLLLIALVVLTSLAHLPGVQATQPDQRIDAVTIAATTAAPGHVIHSHGHLHSTTDHSHAAPMTSATAGRRPMHRPSFGLLPHEPGDLPEISLGLKRPPRT